MPAAHADSVQKAGSSPPYLSYVIDRGGVIRALRADADYVKRMEPSDIVTALKSISADVA